MTEAVARSRWWLAAMSVLFFTSGATSLVYEIIWLRGFAIVLGGTVYSMSCVLTAFMGGLALGATLATRFVQRNAGSSRARFIRTYGKLELFIALYGLALTPALFFGQQTWLGMIGHFQDSSALGTLAVHFTFSLVALLLPTACMGATLPILVMGLERERDAVGLYSFNTFGAATGSLVASFVLIYFWGVVPSTVVVSVLNVLICLASLGLARRLENQSATPAAAGPSPEPSRETAAPSVAWSQGVLLALAFSSGLLFFALELVWNRGLSILLGNRVYVTSITLATVLVCLGLGARLSRVLLLTWPPERILMGCYAFAAVSLCVGVLAEPAFYTRSPGLLALFLVAGIPLPAIALGVVFPLLLMLPAQGVLRGVHVGRLYALNTVGAMLGSLATGYVLFAALGSTRILLLGVGLLVVSMALLVGAAPGAARPHRAVVAVLTLSLVLAFGLRWNSKLSTVPPERTEVVDEDAYGIFTIARTRGGFLSVRCNATELVYLFGDPSTQFVQESQAHFPLLFARQRSEVLVIGSGYGITAGAAGRWPGVSHVDAVEILPLMVANADRFSSGNHEYHRNPRVSVHVADGRHFLAASPKKYDVISINVSDPYLPGSSSLFSTEFYELVTRTLNKDAVVCQHLFGPDVASLYHGFKKHFLHVKVLPSYEGGVSVIGSQSPLELVGGDAFLDPVISKVMGDVGLGSLEELEERLAEGVKTQARLEAEIPAFINSDVHPALEFRRSAQVSLLKSNF